ncbi:PfkB family carbohydrate kinase [Hymenobacter terrenus]|uniref:PfkB family carbohydrate kinase n=1 Tax=Hymenobacter terrenus TaxID=1629124 RepID=UPI0006194267|nr:PfkB family carbohydrate kinase [Hymenobacter terrenus]
MISSAAIVCFGETLWDLLAGGHRPGGMPCRVALHLQQLGQPVQLVSRVGDDELGHKLLAVLAAHGLDPALVQLSATHLTGLVKSPEPAGGVKYHKIVQPLAWDYIPYTEALYDAVARGQMLVYGTLAARSPVSRETLYRLLPHAPFKVLDLNLHAAHCSREVVKYLLKQADLVKLNAAELAEITAWQGQPAPAETAVPWLAKKYGLQAVCLMRGATGASLYKEGMWWHSTGFGTSIEDPDGYGAGFLAALLVSWITGQSPVECLRRACAAGAVVTGQYGSSSPILSENNLNARLQSV